MLKKIFLLPIIICLGLSIGLTTLAQEDPDPTSDEVSEEVIIDETVEPEDLDQDEPGLLPSSRLYFIKEWGRGIRSFFTFGKLNKAEYEASVVNEKILELQKMIDEGEGSKQIEKAIEVLEKVALLYPENIQVHKKLGNIFLKNARFEHALREFTLVTRLDPDEVSGHYNLGRIYKRIGEMEKAVEEWEICAKLDPNGKYGMIAKKNLIRHRLRKE